MYGPPLQATTHEGQAHGRQGTREQINKLGTDMKSITDKARDESRELTDDEERSFGKMDADREKLRRPRRA
jgi:hypothetical protein